MGCLQLMNDHDLTRFRTKACQRHVLGYCEFQDRCQYSHSKQAQRRCPFLLLKKEPLTILRYLPMYCEHIDAGIEDSDPTSCPRGNGCPFAHCLEEILYHPLMYKQKQCPYLHDQCDKKVQSNGTREENACSQYYCPFIHHLNERRPLQKTTYFLAPSFVKKVVLRLPQPLCSIPVSMLNTGRLAELKRVPDELLESLVVSRAIEAMKNRSQSENEWMTALNKNELHRGSLCLVGAPFKQRSNEIKNEIEDDHADIVAMLKEAALAYNSFEPTMVEAEDRNIKLLDLCPGEVVEILGPFPLTQIRSLRDVFFYGRTGTTTFREGWFPATILIGVLESDGNYTLSINRGIIDGAGFSLNASSVVKTDNYSTHYQQPMLTPLPQRSLTNTITVDTTTGGDSSDNDMAGVMHTPIQSQLESQQQQPSEAFQLSGSLCNNNRWVSALQQLCNELEGHLLVELINGMLEVPVEFNTCPNNPNSNANVLVTLSYLKQLKVLVDRIQASLNHLETVASMKALQGSTAAVTELIERTAATTTTTSSSIKTPVADTAWTMTPPFKLQNSYRHRVSAASTHSGTQNDYNDTPPSTISIQHRSS